MGTRDMQLEAKILATMKGGKRQTVDGIAMQIDKRSSSVYQVLRRLEERGELLRTPGDRRGDAQRWYIPRGLPLREVRRASLAGEIPHEIDKIEIESGIPVTGRQGRGDYDRLLQRMKVGDSVVVTHGQRRSLYGAAKRQGAKILARKIESGLTRIWRIK